MPTVFLVLAQFSHYSDVLRAKLIQDLAERFRIVVLTPAIDGELSLRDQYFQHPNVIYYKIAISRQKFWMIFDKYFRVPLVRELDHLTYMRYFYRRPHAWVRKFLMRIRVLFPKKLFHPDRITRWEVRLAKPSAEFTELVKEHKPALLVTATPGFTAFEAEAIVFAKTLGIPTAAVNINYDNLTSNGKMIRKTDYLAVWNERMKQEAVELHRYQDDQLRVVGCLRFDHYFLDPKNPRFPAREVFLKGKGLDPAKPTIVFAGPTPSNYPPRKEFVSELLRLKREKALSGDPNVLVRIHPIDQLEIYKEFENISGVHFERAGRQTMPDTAGGQKIEMGEDDLFNLTATLKYADVVLNFASTVIMEACIFNRPVINIGFPEYRRIVYQFEYNKGLLDTGAVRLAHDPQELGRMINEYLAHPDLDHAERAKLVRDYIPFQDGKTHERTADFISQILQ